MENKHILGIAGLAMVFLLGIGLVSAYGFGNGFMSGLTEAEKTELQEQREAMRTAIENEDYETWKALMENRIQMMQERITEENFNSMIERHQEREEFRQAMQEARESGDFETMQQLREEYGFPGKGIGKGMKGNSGECPQLSE